MKKISVYFLLSFLFLFSAFNSNAKQQIEIPLSADIIEVHKPKFKKYVKKQKSNAKLYSDKLPNWVVGYTTQARECFLVGFEVFEDPQLDQFLDAFGNHDHDVEHINSGLDLLVQTKADKNTQVLLLQELLIQRLGLSRDITPQELLELVQRNEIERNDFVFGVLRNLFINYLKDENII